MAKPFYGYPNCGGATVRNYLFATKKTTFEEAKLCCSFSNMEIYDVLDKADMNNFANVVSPLKKRNHKFQITFWVNGGVTAEELSLQLCPIVIWSSNTQEESTFTFRTEKCALQHVYVCRALETTGTGNSVFEGARKLLPTTVPLQDKRAVVEEIIIANNKPCHLAPLKYGLYVSSEKMNFHDARACCLKKGLNVLSPIWSDSKSSDLKIAFASSFRNQSEKEVLWSTPVDKACFAFVIEDDKSTIVPVSCFESYHAFCENRGFNHDTCQHMEFEPLNISKNYSLSVTQATHMEAEDCCRQHGKYLLDFEEQSRDLLDTLVQRGYSQTKSMVSIFWTVGERSIGSSSFRRVQGINNVLSNKEFCLSAIAIFGKEDFLITDVACEQRLHFVCNTFADTPAHQTEQEHARRKKSSIYSGRGMFPHV